MYINATLWNDIQITDATNEKRYSQLGIIDAVADSTPFVDYIPPSKKEELRKVSSLRKVQIPVLKDQEVTVVTTPGFNYIPSNLPETDQYYYTAYDVFSGFRHYPSTYANNTVDSDWARAEVMKNVAFEMGNTVEGILATVLETRKSQVLDFLTQVSQGDGTFTFAASTLTVSKAAQKETMFYNLETLMKANKLGGGYRIVTTPGGLSVQIAEQLKYSASNSQNKNALGMFPMDRMYESHNISTAANFNGWLIRDGAIGVIENFPYDFAKGTVIDSKKWTITDMDLPFCRMRANIFTNAQATDATALITAGTDTNTIMTTFEEMGIWLRFYVVYRYNSDLSTRANDIVKIVGATA